jgi:hypothetical protein
MHSLLLRRIALTLAENKNIRKLAHTETDRTSAQCFLRLIWQHFYGLRTSAWVLADKISAVPLSNKLYHGFSNFQLAYHHM